MTLRVVTDQQGLNNEMKMSAEKCATQIPFTLRQCGVPTLEKCGTMSELCTVMCAREKCVSARVQVGVLSTVSFPNLDQEKSNVLVETCLSNS